MLRHFFVKRGTRITRSYQLCNSSSSTATSTSTSTATILSTSRPSSVTFSSLANPDFRKPIWAQEEEKAKNLAKARALGSRGDGSDLEVGEKNGENNSNNDNNNNNNGEEKKKKKDDNGFGMWLYALLAFPWAKYIWDRRQIRKKAEEDARMNIVSCDNDEILEIISKARFDMSVFREFQALLAEKYPSGFATPDELSAQVQLKVGEGRSKLFELYQEKAKKHAEKLKQESILRDKENEELEIKLEKEADRIFYENNPHIKKDDEDEDEEEEEEEDPEYECEFEEYYDYEYDTYEDDGHTELHLLHVAKLFDCWEAMLFLRHSKLDSQKRVPIQDMLTALAICSVDSKPEDEWIHDPKFTKGQLKKMNRDPTTKLKLVLEVADTDKDGYLSYDELVNMLRLMIRTGHFDEESLVIQTSMWPIKYEPINPFMIANAIYKQLNLSTPTPTPNNNDNNNNTTNTRVRGDSTSDGDGDGDMIAVDDVFHELCECTLDQTFILWYLVDHRVGGIKRFFRGVKAKAVRFYKRYEQGNSAWN